MIADRLIYASQTRCRCGAGLAYDPTSQGKPGTPFKGPSEWDCGDILRYEDLSAVEKKQVDTAEHDAPAPFAFYEVKSERQPSANGATTRPS